MLIKKLPVNISTLTKDKLRQWIKSFDIVLTDCDYVLWKSDVKLEGSDSVINRLRDMGKKIYFVTNNSTKTREDLVQKANLMNFNIKKENIISTAYLCAKYLKDLNFNKKVYITGPPSVAHELDALGISHFGVGPDPITETQTYTSLKSYVPDKDVGAVIVGYDEFISYPKICKTANYLANPDVIFLGTNIDEIFLNPKLTIPGPGSIIRSFELCARRKANVVGKPNTLLSEVFFRDEKIKDPKRYLMIGDTLHTDIVFAKTMGYQTLFVETGVSQMEHVHEHIEAAREKKELELHIPDYHIAQLADLLNNFD